MDELFLAKNTCSTCSCGGGVDTWDPPQIKMKNNMSPEKGPFQKENSHTSLLFSLARKKHYLSQIISNHQKLIFPRLGAASQSAMTLKLLEKKAALFGVTTWAQKPVINGVI